MTLIERKDEVRGKNEIILAVYKVEDDTEKYSYSIQCKLCRFVRAVFPHQIGNTYPSIRAAKKAAVTTLRTWVKQSRAAKEQLSGFDLLAVDQLELFPSE